MNIISFAICICIQIWRQHENIHRICKLYDCIECEKTYYSIGKNNIVFPFYFRSEYSSDRATGIHFHYFLMHFSVNDVTAFIFAKEKKPRNICSTLN